jgi:membrane associated rhomboid family serine protease
MEMSEGDFFINRWGAIPVAVVKGYVPVERVARGAFFARSVTVRQPVSWKERLLPLLTSLFLHGSLAHLLGNMLFLFVFGDNVEGRLGHFGFLAFYLGGGVFASLSHIMIEPGSPLPIVGASGAISAVLGAYFLLFPRSLVVTFLPVFIIPLFVHVPALLFIGLWFATQLTNGFGSLLDTTGGIAWWAHIGGFVFGAALTFWNYQRWRRRRARYTAAEPFFS